MRIFSKKLLIFRCAHKHICTSRMNWNVCIHTFITIFLQKKVIFQVFLTMLTKILEHIIKFVVLIKTCDTQSGKTVYCHAILLFPS